MDRVYYAHTDPAHPGKGPDAPGVHWQTLKDHLQQTAQLAKDFASAFGAGEWGYIAGLLHDLGKYADQFQQRLQNPSMEKGRDHSTAGAAAILSCYKHLGEFAALTVEGHHTGLQRIRAQRNNRPSWRSWLQEIETKKTDRPETFAETDFQLLIQRFKLDGMGIPILSDQQYTYRLNDENSSAAAMLGVRMLYSALVDGDFVDTEAHFNRTGDAPIIYRQEGPSLNVESCQDRLNRYMTSLRAKPLSCGDIQSMREQLLHSCKKAAGQPTGLFTLTAPTGAGKTLAMLTFALQHAAKHGLRRIVLVMPYINIIDQTAKIYNELFEPSDTFPANFIIEDHSLAHTYDSKMDDDSENESLRVGRLLSENWDAPIVLTTNIKCLESMMANRSSSCRKLHRLAKSIILLDEVQTLPPKLVVPTLGTLSRLADPNGPYGCSIVFSTATQPAFDHLHDNVFQLNQHGWKPREIVPDSGRMFTIASKRINISWRFDQPIEPGELVDELGKHDQFLCVVNLKRHASELTRSLKQTGVVGLYHLSTNMCPAHRKTVLEAVQACLCPDQNRPVRLIATQCVEAGVDVDFPVVYRALAPLDSLAQAAGRCNRHGGQPERGKVVVFQFTSDGRSQFPPGYKEGVQATEIFLNNLKAQHFDLDNIEIFNHPKRLRSYYRQFYDLTGHGDGSRADEENLWRAIKEGDFKKVAQAYKLIEQDQINILVPYDREIFERLREQMESDEPRTLESIRKWITQARPYTVSLFRPQRDNMAWSYFMPIQFSRHRERDNEQSNWFYLLPTAEYNNLLGLVLPDELIV